MRIAHGRVVEGEPLLDGTKVVVVIDEPSEDEPFHLTPEQEDQLRQSIREADQGLGVDAWQFLRDLAREKIEPPL